jgi:hypothetical protein
MSGPVPVRSVFARTTPDAFANGDSARRVVGTRVAGIHHVFIRSLPGGSMQKRIATTALAALFAAGSLFGALAKPASADSDDHARHAQHHHAYQSNNGNHTGWTRGSGNTGNWVNGKNYGSAYNANGYNANRRAYNGNGAGNRRDRDDRSQRRDHHKDTDNRR